MTDVNTSEGAILEALNGKADLDLANSQAANAFKSQSAGWGMPSNSFVDLDLGVSGSTYTAPANGWYFLSALSGKSSAYLGIANTTKGYGVSSDLYTTTSTFRELLPVSKGDIIEIFYSATGGSVVFRFYYAEGEI